MIEEVESETLVESSPSAAPSPAKSDDHDRLTTENFTIVREQVEAVHSLIST